MDAKWLMEGGGEGETDNDYYLLFLLTASVKPSAQLVAALVVILHKEITRTEKPRALFTHERPRTRDASIQPPQNTSGIFIVYSSFQSPKC